MISNNISSGKFQNRIAQDYKTERGVSRFKADQVVTNKANPLVTKEYNKEMGRANPAETKQPVNNNNGNSTGSMIDFKV